MEKNIVDYFKKVLAAKDGHRLSMNSFRGHLAELSQKERKYIKKHQLEKILSKFPDVFLILDDDIYLIAEKETTRNSPSPEINKGDSGAGVVSVQDKKSTVNLESAKDDPCTVCSDPIEIFAIGECRHPICYRCSTKLRVLCDDKSCPVCRQTLELVVFSKKLLPLDEHDIGNYIPDKKHGIFFENIQLCEHKSALLRHICPSCPNSIFDTFSSLEAHARDKHQLYYCSICVQQCKIFTEERKTYTKSELVKHVESGEDSGSVVGGHPLCEFCKCRYLDNDELLRHLRLHHCSCHICDEVNAGQKNYQFYADKNSLFEHQQEKHFICEHPECMDLDIIPVFKDRIDFQAHTLHKHSEQKTKHEKRADKIIDLNLMFETKKVRSKRILKVVPDAVGGINITGVVARRIEREFSFIERDDAPHQFNENVFFDVEACGLEPYDDIRKYFKSGDRVTAYATPVDNPYVKSKWKAHQVEKVEDDYCSDSDDDLYSGLETGSSNSPQPGTWNDFPILAQTPSNSTTTLTGWNRLGGPSTNKPRMKPVRHDPVAIPSLKQGKDYEVGYVHKNLTEKFGFIQRSKYEVNFYDNIYFKIDSFVTGVQQVYGDLRGVLSIGDKVCYILDPTPPPPSSKSKYRAKRVWKFSENINIDHGEPSNFLVGATQAKPKVPQETNIKPHVAKPSNRYEVLAEEYRKSLDTGKDSDSNSSTDKRTNVSDYDDLTKNRETAKKVEQYGLSLLQETTPKFHMNSAINFSSNLEGLQKSASNPVVTYRTRNGEQNLRPSMIDLVTKQTENHNQSNSVKNGKSILGPVLQEAADSGSEDGVHPFQSQSKSDVYSSEDEDSSDDDDDDDDDLGQEDPDYGIYMNALSICLKNTAMFKILKQQISKEMKNKNVKDHNKLQFVEFQRDDKSASILFYGQKTGAPGNGVMITPPNYVKLQGFYPLDSSWFGELKQNGKVVKLAKDLHNITNSCHYITVSRNKAEKVSKVTVHYRTMDTRSGAD